MTTPHIGYTYCIIFKPTRQFYYGSRCAKNCHPSELWATYFTSSVIVKNLIEKHGTESFEYEIRKIFPVNPKQAQFWEKKVLRRMKASQRPDCLNRSNGVVPSRHGWRNSFFGKEHSDITRKVLSERASKRIGEKNSNWKGGKTALRKMKKYETEEEKREAQSIFMMNNNPMSCKEKREKVSDSAKRRMEDGSNPFCKIHVCPKCCKIGKGPSMFRFHFDNCRYHT